MHVAYVWSEQIDNDKPDQLLANSLLNNFRKPDTYVRFKKFLRWDENIQTDIACEDSVLNLLNIGAIAFYRKDRGHDPVGIEMAIACE